MIGEAKADTILDILYEEGEVVTTRACLYKGKCYTCKVVMLVDIPYLVVGEISGSSFYPKFVLTDERGDHKQVWAFNEVRI
jgi:hypothetical protein